MADHVRVNLDTNAFEEVDEADALDHFAGALVFQSVFSEEVENVLGQLDEPFVIVFVFHFVERNDHGAHQVTDLERTLTTDQDADTLFVAGRQGFGANVDAVHALHAAFVVDVQGVVVVERQRTGRAHVHDLVVERLAAQFRNLFLDLFLIDFDVVGPGAQNREVRTVRGVHAVVGAAGELGFELVRQGRAVHVIEHVVDDHAHRLAFVVAGLFATGRTHAAHGGTHASASATEVEAHFVEFVKSGLHVVGADALEHDVAGLAVESDQAGAVLFPNVAHFAQRAGVVVHTGGGHDAERVELCAFLVLAGNFREAGDHASAIAAHTNGAAFPVALAGFVGVLELAEQALHDRGIGFAFVVSQALQAGDEARPRAAFELIKKRSIRFIGRHFIPFLRRVRSIPKRTQKGPHS